MKVAIIEDEKYTLDSMVGMLKRISPDIEILFTSRSVEDTVAKLKNVTGLDVLFADIELEDGNCFEIFEQIIPSFTIIFTTAYSEYALKAFEVHGFDYLLKPVTEKALSRTLDALSKTQRNENVTISGFHHACSEMMSSIPSYRSRILIHIGDNYSYLPIDDVSYFYSENKYIMAVDKKGASRITEFVNLGDVAATLNPNEFFQISRSVLVHISSIKRVSKFFNGRLNVTVSDDAGANTRKEIVSAARRKSFLNWLNGLDGIGSEP